MSTPLTPLEALSGISGSMSLAAWVFLLVPQLVETYRQRSAAGISLTFLTTWFVGDACNLAGALWAGLVPTVIALAVYFCFADAVLISQCLYYNRLNRRIMEEEDRRDKLAAAEMVKDGNVQEEDSLAVEQREDSPLLPPHLQHSTPTRKPSFGDVTDSNLGLPGSRRRSSVPSHRRPSTPREALQSIYEDSPHFIKTSTPSWVKNTASILAILLLGALGWLLAYRTGVWTPTPTHTSNNTDDKSNAPLGASILGYTSALLYLGARIPQIIKNQRERSCSGLSLLFFLLSLVGNATYGAGILLHSVEKEYIWMNLPWLLGSLGTMVEDGVIFLQFRMFGEGEEKVEGLTEGV